MFAEPDVEIAKRKWIDSIFLHLFKRFFSIEQELENVHHFLAIHSSSSALLAQVNNLVISLPLLVVNN